MKIGRTNMNTTNQNFEEVYKQTINKAYYMAFSIVKDQESAKDILQEAYIKVFKKIDSLQDKNKLQAWVNTIVRNEALNYLKRNKEYTFSDCTSEDEDGYKNDEMFDIEEDNIDFIPDEHLDYTETKRLMNEMLDSLPAEQRICIFLHFYEQLSMQEISLILNCGEETVKSRIRYAKKKLRAQTVELEKKGTKLYSIQIIPFLVWMFKAESESISGCESILDIKTLIEAVALESVVSSSSATIGGTVKVAGNLVAKKAIITLISVLVVGSSIFVGTIVHKKYTEYVSQNSKESQINVDDKNENYLPETQKVQETQTNSDTENVSTDIYDMIAGEYLNCINSFKHEYKEYPSEYEKKYLLLDINNKGYKELLIATHSFNDDRGEQVEIYSYDDEHLERIYCDEFSYGIYQYKSDNQNYLYFPFDAGTFTGKETCLNVDGNGNMVVSGVKVAGPDYCYKIENIDYSQGSIDEIFDKQIYQDKNKITNDDYDAFLEKYFKVDLMDRIELLSIDDVSVESLKNMLMQDDNKQEKTSHDNEQTYALSSIEIISEDDEYYTVSASKDVWIRLTNEEQKKLREGEKIEKYGTTFEYYKYEAEGDLHWYTFANEYTVGEDELEFTRCFVNPQQSERYYGYKDVFGGTGNVYNFQGAPFLATIEKNEFKISKKAEFYMLDLSGGSANNFVSISAEEYISKYMNNSDEDGYYHFNQGFVKFDSEGNVIYFKELTSV